MVTTIYLRMALPFQAMPSLQGTRGRVPQYVLEKDSSQEK